MKKTTVELRKGPVPGRRILVVDDDIELLLLFQGLLEAHDYEPCLAQNGAQALNLIKSRNVDAILCDLRMPELSGDRLHRAIGRTWPKLLKRFIFVTGNSEHPKYEKFLKSSQAIVLCKPFRFDRLLEQLESVLVGKVQRNN